MHAAELVPGTLKLDFSPARIGLRFCMKGGNLVDVPGWGSINEAERAEGVGKPREKFVRVAAMLDCLHAAVPTGTRKALETGPATRSSVVGM